MKINIQPRADVSYLFSGMSTGTSSVSGGNNWLSDYASIKNGSYGKLMKAYYGQNASDAVKSAAKKSGADKTEANKEYAKVETNATALKKAADTLLDKKLFEQKDIVTKDENGVESKTKGYDTEAIFKAVDSFVSSYNSLVKAVDTTDESNIERRSMSLMNQTLSNSKSLQNVGITLKEDSTLSIDKEKFMKADIDAVKNLFNANGSYGYRVSSQASLIGMAADSASAKGSSYTGNGTYTSAFNNGNLFSSYF